MSHLRSCAGTDQRNCRNGETAAVVNTRTSPSQNIMILVNNLDGADTIDFDEDGVGPKGVVYGEFEAPEEVP